MAVDVALLTVRGDRLHTLLVRRTEHPHRGRFALPGAFVGMRESLEAAARRVLWWIRRASPSRPCSARP